MGLYTSALLLGLCFVPLAFGIYISMRIFNIPDITTDGSYTLGAVVSALWLSNTLPVHLMPVIVFLCCAISGALTGIIHTRLKVNPLLAGILVMTALYSINLSLLGRPNLPLINIETVFNLPFLSSPLSATFFYLIAFVSVVLIALQYLLRTDFGIAIRVTGNNELMAGAMGINVKNMKVLGLAIANGLTGLSGCLVCQYQGYTDINMGIGIIIAGLGSVMIGEALFQSTSRHWLHLLFLVVGSILFRFILAWALAFGLDPNMLKLVSAVFVLLVVTLPLYAKSYFRK